MKNVVALVPARSGSKGIPGKNLKPLNGKPLLQYSIDAAKNAGAVSRVFLSTDSEEIANLGKHLGAEVPFLRPAGAATDEAPMIEVIKHFLLWAKDNQISMDALVLLQPTSPLRTEETIETCLKLYFNNMADSVVTVERVPHRYLPESLMRRNPDGTMRGYLQETINPIRRQNKEILYARNGPAVLVIKPENCFSDGLYGKKIISYEMSAEDSIDIDDHYDFWLAEQILKKKELLNSL